MTTLGLIVGGLVLVVLFATYVMGLLTDSKVSGTSPRGIGAALQSAKTHVVKVPADGFTWNPSLPPGTDNRIYGPGTATYRTTGDGQVQLDYVDSTGRADQWTGALPADYTEPKRAAAPAYAVAKPIVAVVGFVIGYLIANGSTKHDVLIGFAFAILGWVVAAVFVMTTSMVNRTKAYVAQRP